MTTAPKRLAYSLATIGRQSSGFRVRMRSLPLLAYFIIAGPTAMRHVELWLLGSAAASQAGRVIYNLAIFEHPGD